MIKKKALITGITGQDGAYLADLLLSKGYEVHGIKRKASTLNTQRIDHLYQEPHQSKRDFYLHYGDLIDSSCVVALMDKIRPDEVYHLGAQSHVQVSFELPEYTSNVNALGTLRILEAIRILGLEKKIKYYQGSSSEMYGLAQEVPQKENTPFRPRSPYAISKLFGYWITVNYREAYGLYACNGILFNHESPFRGETFVTRKITRAVTRIAIGLETKLYLGNLNAKRDWGHAKDYVHGIWLMLQQNKPSDYVLATGVVTSVKEFAELAFKEVGIHLGWKGENKNLVGFIKEFSEVSKNMTLTSLKVGDVLIMTDERYYRPTEVDSLRGDPTKAETELGWKRNYDLKSLIQEMIHSDLMLAKKEMSLKEIGYKIPSVIEK